MKNQELTPSFRFMKLLWQNRVFILVFSFSFFVLSIIYSLLLPKWYEGRVVFIINEEKSYLGSFSSSLLGNVGLPSNFLGDFAKPLSEQYINFLQSHSILDKIDSIYKLQEAYEIKYRKSFYRRILSNARFVDNNDNSITIYFYYKEDPDKAASIANSFFIELEKLVSKLRSERNEKIKNFLERTYTETIDKLVDAEEKMKKFQLNNKVYSLDDQVKLVIQNISELEAQRIQLAIQKEYLESSGAKNTVEYQALINKIIILNKSINSLKTKSEYIDVPLEDLPLKGLEYIRILREIKIREKILEFVVPQLENARMQEFRISSTLQLLDSAVPQDYKSKPKRIVIVFVVTFFAFTFSILFLLIKAFIRNNRRSLTQVFNKE